MFCYRHLVKYLNPKIYKNKIVIDNFKNCMLWSSEFKIRCEKIYLIKIVRVTMTLVKHVLAYLEKIIDCYSSDFYS